MNASMSRAIFKCSVRIGKGENYVLKTGQGTCIIKAGNQMAELSRFFGIIIRMFAEHGGKHHTRTFMLGIRNTRQYLRLILWKSFLVLCLRNNKA